MNTAENITTETQRHRESFSLSGKLIVRVTKFPPVRLELQADFFAGVFARYVQNQGILEAGDIDEDGLRRSGFIY